MEAGCKRQKAAEVKQDQREQGEVDGKEDRNSKTYDYLWKEENHEENPCEEVMGSIVSSPGIGFFVQDESKQSVESRDQGIPAFRSLSGRLC